LGRVFAFKNTQHPVVNRVLANDVRNPNRAGLALAMQTGVELLVVFERPVKAKPNAQRAAFLQI